MIESKISILNKGSRYDIKGKSTGPVRCYFFRLYLKKGWSTMNDTKIREIHEKLDRLIHAYNTLKSDNERLMRENMTLKATQEAKDNELRKLLEEKASKESEIDAIASKLDELLN